MEEQKGKTISGGAAVGRIWFYSGGRQSIPKYAPKSEETELARFEEAKRTAATQLSELYRRACDEMGEAEASIFDAQSLMLMDEDFNELVYHFIHTEHVNAEYAVTAAAEKFVSIFSHMQDDYMKSRAVDVKDVSQRITAILMGKGFRQQMGEEPVIVMAKELVPSQTVQMDKSKLLGFVTETGSINSHVAILARTMKLPALSGVSVTEQWDGRLAVLDGEQGILYIDPDEDTLSRAALRQREEEEKTRKLRSLIGKETVTKAGRRISLFANAANLSDVEQALANDAEGVGLFRSEFLYLEKNACPTEEEQFMCYRAAAELLSPKRLVIRTLDIGADKRADYFGLEREENPAMGFRAIRICLSRPDMFKTQLRAIFRAAACGNIAVMYPMIISVSEVQRIKRITEEVKQELKREGIPYGDAAQGIMIETPAAAMISDLLAREVDFFSIGTNDLSQYALAIDRQNPRLDGYFDAYHPAIFRMLRLIVENGHKGGCQVGICGELAADLRLTEAFLDMGIDDLSVAPASILPLREKIRRLDG